MTKPAYKFISVVWGEEFTNSYINVVLPSLLSPNNLPYISKNSKSLLRIYTTSDYVEKIRVSKSIKIISQLIEVEIIKFSGLSYINKYQCLAQATSHCMREFKDENSAFIFIHSDVVWADGSLKKIMEKDLEGKRVILVGEPRVKKEKFISKLIEQYFDDNIINISSRELVKISLDCLHPEMLTMIWGKLNKKPLDPNCLFWEINNSGLLMRIFNLNPIMLRPNDNSILPNYNIDSEYLDKAFNDTSEMYIVEDSDLICTMDFTDEKDRIEYLQNGSLTIDDVSNWAYKNINRHQKEFINFKIKLHYSDIDQNNWNKAENESDEVIKTIQSKINDLQDIHGKIAYHAPGDPSNRPKLSYFLNPTYIINKIKEIGIMGIMKKVLLVSRIFLLNILLGRNIKIIQLIKLHD